MLFQTSQEWMRWLPRDLRLDNQRRCHMDLGGFSPQPSALSSAWSRWSLNDLLSMHT